MKKFCIILCLMFCAGTLFGQQPTQLQQAQAEIKRLNIVLEDVKVDRDKLTIANAQMNQNAIALNQGVIKATNLLQKGYDSGKLNYEELRLLGFNISVDSSNVYQRPKSNGKSNPQK